ncbi:MAG: 50S ribosomal protein L28 [Candidatus Yanofskybacteria bacterium]|nr:50S ribosomal protein L28 [Candidatus Yanofskybacteria bacterium]
MARQMTRCPKCGKKPVRAVKRKLLRGHYNPTKVYRQKPNLQWALVSGKRVKICTDCIKTLNKVRK